MPRTYLDAHERSEQPTQSLGSEVADMRRTVVVLVAALATFLAAAWPASGVPERAPESQQTLADVNGDGFDDLAVGAPGETVGTRLLAGAVSVFEASGGPGGVVAPGPVFTQGGGLGGTAESLDEFGFALE
jgi:hypothetical protein